MQIDLNCDCGESYGRWELGDDAAMFRYVSSANVACGAHAGDPDVMRQTVRQAKAAGVSVGAHPGFPDLLGFGRRVVQMSPDEVFNSVLAQIGALYAIAKVEGVALAHVKAHGALYNYAAVNPSIAQAIADATAAFDKRLIFVALAGSPLVTAGQKAGLHVAQEAFADRAYEADGSLRNRKLAGAMIEDNALALAQVIRMVKEGHTLSHDGQRVAIQADTICLHGDTPGAAARAQFLRNGLEQAGIAIKVLSEK